MAKPKIQVGYAIGAVVAILRMLEDRHGTAACFFPDDDPDTLLVIINNDTERARHHYSLHELFAAGEWVRYAAAEE